MVAAARRFAWCVAALGAATVLAACGGGGSSSSVPGAGTAFTPPAATTAPSATPTPTATPTPAPRTATVLAPLYAAPGTTWQAMIAAKSAVPGSSLIAIVNPASGPGARTDTTYTAGIAQLRAAGIGVAGYVRTGYGTRAAGAIAADVAAWIAWYGVTTVFIDEVPASAGYETAYAAVAASARAAGATFLFGNPGTAITAAYGTTFDALVIYESNGYPAYAALAAAAASTSRPAGYLADGVALDDAFVRASTGLCAYVYATDDRSANPYAAVPSYLAALLRDATN